MSKPVKSRYSVFSAMSHGASFGAMIGFGIAAFGLLASGTLTFPLGVGFASIAAPLLGASLAGTVIGGAVFAASNIITRAIPGMTYALGNDVDPQKRFGRNAEPEKSQEAATSMKRKDGRSWVDHVGAREKDEELHWQADNPQQARGFADRSWIDSNLTDKGPQF